MCGRFTLRASPEAVREAFQLPLLPELTPRHNLAPTQPVAAMLRSKGESERRLVWFRWGLIPSWAQDPKVGQRMINARSETLLEKPSFRGPVRHRRCLVLADGFYEWQQTGDGKSPIYIRRRDCEPFAFAGLWDRWEKGDEPIASCTVLTTEPNALVAGYHHRMPVILNPEDYDTWLDPDQTDPTPLARLLVPCAPEAWEAFPVSKAVNSPANDAPACIEPLRENGTR